MFVTPEEITNYILHRDPKRKRQDVQKFTDGLLRWVAKKRSLYELPVASREEVQPKKDKNIKWSQMTPQQVMEMERQIVFNS